MKFMKHLILLLTLASVSLPALTQDVPKGNDEKESELLKFDSIKSVLKRDQLDKSAQAAQNKANAAKNARLEKQKNLYEFPPDSEMWSFLSELWLVKNAQILKWDFEKPDYGLSEAFGSFLRQMGFVEIRFKILTADSPNLYHFALPSNPNEFIFILSVPFMRTLDVSKFEISLLLFEDFIRAKEKFFQEKVETPELEKMLGTNFQGKKFDKKIINETLKKYDEVIFDKGFNFQEQFTVTNKVNNYLKNDLKMWASYVKLLERIDELSKTNLLFKNYNTIYRSAELQLNWLKPKSGAGVP